jgi:hypothetical protein
MTPGVTLRYFFVGDVLHSEVVTQIETTSGYFELPWFRDAFGVGPLVTWCCGPMICALGAWKTMADAEIRDRYHCPCNRRFAGDYRRGPANRYDFPD